MRLFLGVSISFMCMSVSLVSSYRNMFGKRQHIDAADKSVGENRIPFRIYPKKDRLGSLPIQNRCFVR